jgi:hypothetical protein
MRSGIIQCKTMDEIVLQGLARWPNVPAVYGWLELDRRGDWHTRSGRITHPVMAGFIGRNYAHDDRGRWFFQNGPQRVFVTLRYTPLVYRVMTADASMRFVAHTGRAVGHIDGVWLDDEGSLLLQTEHGPGVVCDRDLPLLAVELIDAGAQGVRWGDRLLKPGEIRAADVPAHFGFIPNPQPDDGEEHCQ